MPNLLEMVPPKIIIITLKKNTPLVAINPKVYTIPSIFIVKYR